MKTQGQSQGHEKNGSIDLSAQDRLFPSFFLKKKISEKQPDGILYLFESFKNACFCFCRCWGLKPHSQM